MTCMIWVKIQNILNEIFLENRQNSGIHAKAIMKVALSRSGGVVFRSIYMFGGLRPSSAIFDPKW